MAYEGQPGSAFVDLEIVREHVASAAEWVGSCAAQSFRESVDGSLRYLNGLRFDSPLEVLFWLWWDAVIDRTRVPGWDCFQVLPQQEVTLGDRLYRVDFLIEPKRETRPGWRPIAVELDGHAFHERTPEQVALRDSRDRALQAADWRIFHFSFREFTARPVDCVAEVFTFARSQWQASERLSAG